MPAPPPEEQQQLMQFIQKQTKLLEQARAIEAQQRAAAAKVLPVSPAAGAQHALSRDRTPICIKTPQQT